MVREWWRCIGRYRNVRSVDFWDDTWQQRNTIKTKQHMADFLREEAGSDIAMDFLHAIDKEPMAIRVSPYILSLIKWRGGGSASTSPGDRKGHGIPKLEDNANSESSVNDNSVSSANDKSVSSASSGVSDPIRRQFIPLGVDHWNYREHPMAQLDSLQESKTKPLILKTKPRQPEPQPEPEAPKETATATASATVSATVSATATATASATALDPPSCIVHRYPNKALFLALSTCPVYCRFCTRSYAVGQTTNVVKKKRVGPLAPRSWERAINYLQNSPQISDVTVSGGDTADLNRAHLDWLGSRILDIEHVRSIRIATKALAVRPSKFLSDLDWMEGLDNIQQIGRKRGKHVCLHTHINHPGEISEMTIEAASRLRDIGIVVRNQSVLLNGVNDESRIINHLNTLLVEMDISPYYIYMHDLIPGTDFLRCPLHRLLQIERETRGLLPGFRTPSYVVDLPGGGGKRLASTYDYYDPHTGISVFSSPMSNGDAMFLMCDPMWSLNEDIQAAWRHPHSRIAMIDSAIDRAKANIQSLFNHTSDTTQPMTLAASRPTTCTRIY